MKLLFKKLFLITTICFLIGFPIVTAVALNEGDQGGGETGVGSLENPLGSEELSPEQLYGRIIYAFMGITGTLALIMFLIGGFQWMTAAGNPERIKKGRDTLMWAVLGLIVIFSSYAILRAILETLQF